MNNRMVANYSGAKASFNTAAQQYDDARPSYPPAVVRRIIQNAKLTKNSKILDIGAGTGKASILFAKRGYEMLCIEPGVQMGEVLRRNLEPYPKAKVLTTTFEDWKPKRGTFDLVISAQAFHWIDPEVGYPKAAQALKPGAWIALFWNLPNDPDDGIYAEIQKAYRKHAPEMGRRQESKSLTEEVNEMRERMDNFSKHFPWRYVYRAGWKKTYSIEQYLALLGTYSDHIALPPERRKKLFDAISKMIDRHGGELVKHYSSMLAMARKRS